MTRKEFYTKYYTRTDKMYFDRTFPSKKQREEAWRKGQINRTSKAERKIFIVLQYALLLAACVFLYMKSSDGIVYLFLSLLFFPVTNFSFIKIELLYRIFFSGNVYGDVLRDKFFGVMGPCTDDIRKSTKKYVHGFYPSVISNDFRVKYKAVPKDKNDKISVIITCMGAKVTVNGSKTVIRQKNITRDELFERISSVICERMEKQ